MRQGQALRRLRVCLVLGLALACAGPGLVGSAWGAPPDAPDPEAPTRAAVGWLKSPFQRERQEAAQLLQGLLPASRGAVLAAWNSGDETVRATLAEVMATEGSPELVGLLLEAWCEGGDALAAAARRALVLHPEATRNGLVAYRAAHPARRTRRPLDSVDVLLARDDVERLFLSRKSKSGGTGVYRGQYDVLRPHREAALEVCLHIFMDKALRLPGTSAVGGYRFLRPVGDVFDTWELRQMALFAISDLATTADAKTLAALDDYLAELRDVPDSPPGGWDVVRDPAWRPEKDYLFDDLLVTLYRLQPTRYQQELDLRLEVLDYRSVYVAAAHAAISMRLRAGMYREAAQGYQRLLARSDSRAGDYYNLACTYALWSLEPGEQHPANLRRLALNALRSAVDEQWTDVAWLEQDRDLDPIRDTPEYRAQVERIKAVIAGDRSVERPRDIRRR